MRFMESSLRFVPPTGNENTIPNRLLTIIGYLAEKEEKFRKIADANEQLKIQLENNSKTDTRPREPVEATLTRVMQNHEVEISRIQGELDAAKNELIMKESFWRNNNEELEQRVAKLKAECNAAEANLNEARTQTDVLSQALARAEKGKSAMALSRDNKDREFDDLQKKYDDLLRSNRARQAIEDDLRRDLEDQKRLYEKARTRSLVTDLEKIQSLTDKLQYTEGQLQKSILAIDDRDRTLAAFKTKVRKLQEENSDGLRQHARLQEELAAKDLILANARSACAGYESTAKLAARERDAAVQRTKLEINVWKNKQEMALKAIEERQKECEFLSAAIKALEHKAEEQSSRLQQEIEASRIKDEYATSLRSKLTVAEDQLLELKQIRTSCLKSLEDNQRRIQAHNMDSDPTRVKVESIDTSQQRNLDDHQEESESVKIEEGLSKLTNELSRAYQERDRLLAQIDELRTSIAHQNGDTDSNTEIEDEMKVEEQELHSDLVRALTRISSLEELVAYLENEVLLLRRVHEEMAEIDEGMKVTLQTFQSEMTWKDRKIERLEKDLKNRIQDLSSKMEELVEVKSKLQEQTSRADILEEERQDLKHQVDTLERLKAEQQEQLEGRERALQRLDDARKTYEKMYESKIETLKEERLVTEQIAQAEISRIKAKCAQEIQEASQDSTQKLSQAEESHDSTMEIWLSEKMALEQERNSLISKVAELEESLRGTTKNIEERNLLLSGYIALVSEKEEGGMLQEGSEVLQNLLEQKRIDMDTIAELTDEIEKLRVVINDQYKLMERYDQDMTSLANRNELYIRQGQEREQELISERKARVKEQTQFKASLTSKEAVISSLEEVLNEKGIVWKKEKTNPISDPPATASPATSTTPATSTIANTSNTETNSSMAENAMENIMSTTPDDSVHSREKNSETSDMDLDP
ncbi:hypothetical protein BGZ46_007009 [Entomortierella lignicola]|nr:hypothetical protein BGZ46_007009 [Entomortierella lignicola]